MGKRLRPSSARDVGDRLKLHLRVLRVDDRDYHVITPRPGVTARFSTNRFHETWHILSDPHGALLLSRLLWGLSYQRRPGTIVVIDRPHLDTNPFDAEPADPIALVPAYLTVLTAQAARQLRHRLNQPGTASGRTVRWHTWGLDDQLTRIRDAHDDGSWIRRRRELWPDPDPYGTRIDRIGGLLIFRAAPVLLRHWALDVARLGEDDYHGMAYTEIHGAKYEPCRADGEVQTFRDYHQRVTIARTSRQEVFDSPAAGCLAPGEVNPLIWRHNNTVRARHRTTGQSARPDVRVPKG
ncbi:hypothetical protein ACQP1V_27565 [Microtetraspora malaysiensis]|uniref:hypothetical protein n=1 Tax=Microtetraspora malaysiensis TaxID=161358 RepID=UPI003D921239